MFWKPRIGEQALKLLQREKPNLVILDLMLPGLSGIELCKLLKQRSDTAKLPILMLTAKAGEADRIVGLEMGADDYLSKPFSPREMVARVRAILRRSEAKPAEELSPSYERGPLKIDFSTYEVFVRSKSVKLTLKEFELLRFLAVQNPNRVLNRGSTSRSGMGRRDLRHAKNRGRSYPSSQKSGGEG